MEEMQTLRSPEAERAVLGSMLVDPSCAEEVINRLCPEDFSLRENREVFEAVRALLSRARPIDGASVLEELQKSGFSGGDARSCLVRLIELTPASASVLEYADIVREKARLRAAQAPGEGVSDERR